MSAWRICSSSAGNARFRDLVVGNWFLSFAAIFAVRDAEDTFGAIVAALDFSRAREGRLRWWDSGSGRCT